MRELFLGGDARCLDSNDAEFVRLFVGEDKIDDRFGELAGDQQ